MQFRTVTGYIRSHHWIVMLFLIVFSFFVLGTIFSGSRYCGYCNARLSEKEGTVLKLTTAATAAATALALVPDDSTTPVADQIMDLTDYGIIITVMILLERFLVHISGTLAFRICVPVGIALYYIAGVRHNPALRGLALRVIAISLCLFLIIPVSFWVEDAVDRTFDLSGSVRISTGEAQIEAESAESGDDRTFLQKTGDFFTGIFNKAKDLGNEAVDRLHNFVDSFVKLLVKDCLIPVGTFFVIYMLCKAILNTIPAFLPVFSPEEKKELTHR